MLKPKDDDDIGLTFLQKTFSSLFTFLLLITCFTVSGKGAPGYQLLHYTDENGLPQNSIKSIVRDEHGFIWMTTEDGLVRYDGRNFVSFRAVKLGLKSSRFLNFFRQAGNVYVHTDQHEQVRLSNGLPLRDSSERSEGAAAFTYIAAESDERRLFSSSLSEQKRWKGLPKSITLRLATNSYYHYQHDTIGFYRDGRCIHKRRYDTHNPWNFFNTGDRLYHYDNGVFHCFSPTGHQTVKLSGDILRYRANGSQPYHDLLVCWNNLNPDALVFYYRKSIFKVTPTASGELHTRILFSDVDIPAKNIVSCYFDEAQRTLFLGASSKGLFVIKQQSFTTLTTRGIDNIFYGHTAYNDTSLLTAQGILFQKDGSSSIVSAMTAIAKSDYYSVVVDSTGHAWFKREARLYKADTKRPMAAISFKMESLIAHLSRYGATLWIALRDGNIYALNTLNDTARPVKVAKAPDPATYLQQIDQVLYVATTKHFYAISLVDNNIHDFRDAGELYITSFLRDREGNFWLTTQGKGLQVLRKDSLVSLPNDKNDYLASAHCIVEDRSGYLWVTTNKGLFQIAKADLLAYADGKRDAPYYHYHDKREGFNTNEFNGNCEPCGVVLNDGVVSFPSINGLVTFYPDSIATRLPGEPIFIDEVIVDNRTLDQQRVVALPRWFNRLQISLSTPYMGIQDNLHLSYALVANGERPVWLDVPDNGELLFSSMPAGNYELIIKKTAGFGRNNYVTKHIGFSVPKAWFETIVFQVIAVLVLTGLAMLIIRTRIRIRTRKMQRRNTELNEMVAAQTRELAWQAGLQERIVRTISHDVQTPLQHQAFVARMLYEHLAEKNDAALSDPARVLQESAQGLHTMMGNLLDYLKVRLDSRGPQVRSVSLHSLVAEKVHLFEAIARRRKTTIYNTIPADLELMTDGQMLSVVLHNLLDNAVKITMNGRIDIDASIRDERCIILVKDTGPGLPKRLVHWMNNVSDDYADVNDTDDHEPLSSGVGLLTVRELVKALGCTLSVTSEPGKGTCFTLIC